MSSIDPMNPNSPGTRVTIEGLQLELAEIATSVRRMQANVRQFALGSDARTRHLTSKVEALEAQNLARVLEMRELEEQNIELQQVVEASTPDLANAIRARNEATRRLAHAQLVIQDLLGRNKTEVCEQPDDYLDDQVEDGRLDLEEDEAHHHVTDKASSSGRYQRKIPTTVKSRVEQNTWTPQTEHPPSVPEATKEAAPKNIRDDSISAALRKAKRLPKRDMPATVESNLVGSDDDSTVRPPQRQSVGLSVTTNPVLTRTTGRLRQHEPVSSYLSGTTAVSSGFSDEPPSSAEHPSDTSKAKKPLSWYLEFGSAPNTAEVVEGAFSFDLVSNTLELSDYTEIEIANLEDRAGFDTRILSHREYVFAYRPVVLEGPKSTYFIGWGDTTTMRNTQKWLKEPREIHLFIYPIAETSGWFYVGLLTLTYVPLELIWSKINKECKTKLLAEYQERNPEMDVMKEFKRGVREGTLVQCCIQLESKGKKAEAHAFMREYGLLSGDARVAEPEI